MGIRFPTPGRIREDSIPSGVGPIGEGMSLQPLASLPDHILLTTSRSHAFAPHARAILSRLGYGIFTRDELASLEATLDPTRMTEEELGEFTTERNGQFSIPVSVIGAGTFEYDLQLVCRSTGYLPIMENLKLPRSSKRLLVVMAPGKDRLERKRDILEESIEAGRKHGFEDQ